MTVAETVLVFIGIPLAVCLLVAAAVYGTSNRHAPRYRPGRPFPFTPVWYVAASPRHRLDDPASPALPAVHLPRALPAGRETGPSGAGTGGAGDGTPTVTGGARGTW
jgi:hypothetical protein